MPKPTVIVSDIHLGAVPEAVEVEFIMFLREWNGRAELMLFNGDLFDFWFEYRTVIPSEYFQVLRALAELRDSGVRLMLVGGNHDAWGGPFLRSEIGVELADGPTELRLAGRQALVAHGDGLGPGDLRYKALRSVIRSRAAHRLMRWVHPDIAERIAGLVSRTGGAADRDQQHSLERGRVLRKYAAELLERRDELDLVVFGHCHAPEVLSLGDRGHYVNSGDWVQHRTYTVVTAEGIEQKEWNQGPKGMRQPT